MNFFLYFNITSYNRCPACGEFVYGFEAFCKDCGLNLCLNNFTTSSYRDYTFKFIFKF